MNRLVNRFAWGLAEGGNLCCLIIVVIFMGLGGACRLREDFKVIIWGDGGQATKVGTIFYGGVDPSRHQVKIFIWQLEEV